MNESAYLSLFRDLGFLGFEKRKLLRHRRSLPSVYFNVSRLGMVYFVARASQRGAFARELWTEIEAQQKKDDVPNLITLVPRTGREREAFSSLIGASGD